MADRMMRVAARDYNSGTAKALRANPAGELAVNNVLGQINIIELQDLHVDNPVTYTINSGAIPVGAGYFGVFIASSSASVNTSLQIETDYKDQNFSQGARFLQKKYTFAPSRERYVIRPLGTAGNNSGGGIRLTISSSAPVAFPARISAWVIFYRLAVPEEVGLEEPSRFQIVRDESFTLAAGASRTFSGNTFHHSLRIFREMNVSVHVRRSHKYSAILNQEFAEEALGMGVLLPSAVAPSRATDMMTLLNNRPAIVLKNESSQDENYRIIVTGAL